jgi:hypothetical protein
MAESDYVFLSGDPLDVGQHGETDYVFHSGDPVPNDGKSSYVFESGTGIGSNLYPIETLNLRHDADAGGGEKLIHYDDYEILEDGDVKVDESFERTTPFSSWNKVTTATDTTISQSSKHANEGSESARMEVQFTGTSTTWYRDLDAEGEPISATVSAGPYRVAFYIEQEAVGDTFAGFGDSSGDTVFQVVPQREAIPGDPVAIQTNSGSTAGIDTGHVADIGVWYVMEWDNVDFVAGEFDWTLYRAGSAVASGSGGFTGTE